MKYNSSDKESPGKRCDRTSQRLILWEILECLLIHLKNVYVSLGKLTGLEAILMNLIVRFMEIIAQKIKWKVSFGYLPFLTSHFFRLFSNHYIIF